MSDFYQGEFFSEATPEIVFEATKLSARTRSIHDRAIRRAKTYLIAEAELLESIIEIDEDRTYEKFGEQYLTPYCEKYLGLSGDVAANFVRVARKSREVPELKLAINRGELTVTKAKVIASVITPENSAEWIGIAKTLSKDKVEREVTKVNPKLPNPEKAKPVSVDAYRVEFEFKKEQMERLRRAQDLICQSLGHSASIAETVDEAKDTPSLP